MNNCRVHSLVDGLGAMGDAVKCRVCGYSSYPSRLSLIVAASKAAGLFTPESHPDYDKHVKEANEAERQRELRERKPT